MYFHIVINCSHLARKQGINKYIGYPESEFRWAIMKRNKKYVTNHVYCHLMYIMLLL